MRVGLNAVIIALGENDPMVLRVAGSDDVVADALPWGEFDPQKHRTMILGLREHIKSQTGMNPKHIEQLYTFGDRGRQRSTDEHGDNIISVGYLVSTPFTDPHTPPEGTPRPGWKSLYSFLPWEDWRDGRPAMLDETIIPALKLWCKHAGAYGSDDAGLTCAKRMKIAFGLGSHNWDETRVIERYELMYEAGLVVESVRDGRYRVRAIDQYLGSAMRYDHRRIVATALVRMRQKLQRQLTLPEFLPPVFTLTQLQASVEKIRGVLRHKQNFRRQIDNENLVVQTQELTKGTGGRPAALFKFRKT